MKEVFVYYGGNQKVPKDVERVRIDPSAKIISKGAFEFCRKLKYVEFCDGVQEIGEAAFYFCINLESVRMASTTKIILKGAFKNCSKLRYLLLNEGLDMIGLEAFENCESIEYLELPSTMRHIQGRAFRFCKSLRQVVFNKELEEVGTNAFQYCTNLKSVVNVGCKTKFGHGSKKWIPRMGMKDEALWNLVSSNADNADKVLMANCGMFQPSDRDYLLPTQQAKLVELQTRQHQGQQQQQKMAALLESWKKAYFSVQTQRNTLQAQYNSLQIAYFQVAAREEDSRRRLHAMTAQYSSKMDQTTTQSAVSSLSKTTSTVGCQTNDMETLPRNDNDPSVDTHQENASDCCKTEKGKNTKNALKRKMPMQDSTNQQPMTGFKKLRPIC